MSDTLNNLTTETVPTNGAVSTVANTTEEEYTGAVPIINFVPYADLQRVVAQIYKKIIDKYNSLNDDTVLNLTTIFVKNYVHAKQILEFIPYAPKLMGNSVDIIYFFLETSYINVVVPSNLTVIFCYFIAASMLSEHDSSFFKNEISKYENSINKKQTGGERFMDFDYVPTTSTRRLMRKAKEFYNYVKYKINRNDLLPICIQISTAIINDDFDFFDYNMELSTLHTMCKANAQKGRSRKMQFLDGGSIFLDLSDVGRVMNSQECMSILSHADPDLAKIITDKRNQADEIGAHALHQTHAGKRCSQRRKRRRMRRKSCRGHPRPHPVRRKSRRVRQMRFAYMG